MRQEKWRNVLKLRVIGLNYSTGPSLRLYLQSRRFISCLKSSWEQEGFTWH